jgi:hypothetical protein
MVTLVFPDRTRALILPLYRPGKLILRGFVAGRTFFIGVSFMTITDVAPVSATACVMGIVGLLGCVLGAHILHHHVDTLEVTTVVLSSSLCIFLMG